MGTCKYCGESAGFLRKEHPACAQKCQQGWQRMVNLVQETISTRASLDELVESLHKIAKGSYIEPNLIRASMIRGWENTVDCFLNDGNLDEGEEKQLTSFVHRFSLSQKELDSRGAYAKVVKGATLRDLMNGRFPKRLEVAGNVTFNFQKSESLIWIFADVAYYEDRTRKQFVGGYHGVSLRIAKGVYYRAGGFQGNPVETSERVHVDTGQLAVTNKHIYFGGALKAFRIKFDKIVSYTPYSNGIGIQRDAATAKPQIFVTEDGWFTYNLLQNAGNV